MHLVTPELVIGSCEDAENPELLHRFNIDAVLSLEPVRILKPVACQLILRVQDRIALPEAVITQAVDFIQQQIAQGRNVLVHCQMGISRSPALVLAYLHQHQGLSLQQALARIQQLRPQAEPHPALLASLQHHFRLATPDHYSQDQRSEDQRTQDPYVEDLYPAEQYPTAKHTVAQALGS